MNFSHIGQSQGCHFPDNMKFPDFSKPRLSSTMIPRPSRGSGGMLPQKIFKIRIFNLAENELLTTKFPDFLGKFPDLQGSLSNSLTFPSFPGQWQPCKAATFQQFFNLFCFVPLWFSFELWLASWEGSLVLAYGQNKTDQMWLVCLQVQVEFRCQHWSWGRVGALPLS